MPGPFAPSSSAPSPLNWPFYQTNVEEGTSQDSGHKKKQQPALHRPCCLSVLLVQSANSLFLNDISQFFLAKFSLQLFPFFSTKPFSLHPVIPQLHLSFSPPSPLPVSFPSCPKLNLPILCCFSCLLPFSWAFAVAWLSGGGRCGCDTRQICIPYPLPLAHKLALSLFSFLCLSVSLFLCLSQTPGTWHASCDLSILLPSRYTQPNYLGF